MYIFNIVSGSELPLHKLLKSRARRVNPVKNNKEVKIMFEKFAIQINELAMIVGYSTVVLGVLYLASSVAKGLYNKGKAEGKKEKK